MKRMSSLVLDFPIVMIAIYDYFCVYNCWLGHMKSLAEAFSPCFLSMRQLKAG